MYKIELRFFLLFAGVIYIIAQLATGNIWQAIGISVTIAILLHTLYQSFLWRFNKFEKTPKLYKKYRAEFISTYNGEMKSFAEITVRQSLSSISVTERWGKSTCESKTAELKKTDAGNWELYYTYYTKAITTNTEKTGDEAHYGTCILDIQNPDKITGHYFTDRKYNAVKGEVKWLPAK